MAEQDITFEECLDDISSRFILNIPEEELASFERLFFQLEEASWFYDDFYCDRYASLPRLKLKRFCTRLFKHVPFLQRYQEDFENKYNDWKAYKLKVPVYGAILIDQSLTKCLLVKGWSSSATWGFPKGKINKDEPSIVCAIREVYEETGYDFGHLADEDIYLESSFHGRRTRLYLVKNVPIQTQFSTLTRKEISKIQWYGVDELPPHPGAPGVTGHKFFLVAPFVPEIKRYCKQELKRRLDKKKTKNPADVDDAHVDKIENKHVEEEVDPITALWNKLYNIKSHDDLNNKIDAKQSIENNESTNDNSNKIQSVFDIGNPTTAEIDPISSLWNFFHENSPQAALPNDQVLNITPTGKEFVSKKESSFANFKFDVKPIMDVFVM